MLGQPDPAPPSAGGTDAWVAIGALLLATVFVLACGVVGAVVGYGAWFAFRAAFGGGGDVNAGDLLLHLGYLGGGFAGLLTGIRLATTAWERFRPGPHTEGR